MTAHGNTTPTYRGDVDGLRAVAVLAVFAYHLGLPGVGGGFVGVDVFFVISGYLISRILFAEYDRTGRIDYRAFYTRRIRRIIPALFVTLLLATIAAVVFLSPRLLIEYTDSLAATLVSASNIYFAGVSGYFDTEASAKPLLHTWSLGVEEQFYFVWPLCVAVLCRWPKWRLAGVVGLAVTATVAAQSWVIADPTNAFYQMPARIGEFALGAVVTLLPVHRPVPRWAATVAYGLGLVAIGASIVGYSDATLFPGYSALLPCLGAATCIWGAPQAIALPRLLDNPLMVRIGLWSYVLYLVHWPVIVYAPFVRAFRSPTVWDHVILVAVVFGVASLLHTFVETPLRHPTLPWRRFAGITGALALFLVATTAGLWAAAGWQQRSWVSTGALTPEAVADGQNARFQINALMCEQRQLDCSPPTDGKPRIIIENPPADEYSVLVIGDSHAVDAMNALYPVLPEAQFYLSQLGACPPRRDIAAVVGKRFANLAACLTLTEKRFDPSYLRQFDAIAINVLYVRYGIKELDAYLTFLAENGIANVIVFGDFVTLTRDMAEIVDAYGFSDAAVEQHRSARPNLDERIATTVAAHGFFYISKYAAFCPSGRCAWFDADDVPFTYDKSHLSYPYASRLALPSAAALRAYLGQHP